MYVTVHGENNLGDVHMLVVCLAMRLAEIHVASHSWSAGDAFRLYL